MQPFQESLLVYPVLSCLIPVINLNTDEDTNDNHEHFDDDDEPVLFYHGFS